MSHSPTARHCSSALRVLLDGLSTPNTGDTNNRFSAPISRLHNDMLGTAAHASSDIPLDNFRGRSPKRRRLTGTGAAANNGEKSMHRSSQEHASYQPLEGMTQSANLVNNTQHNHSFIDSTACWVQQSMTQSRGIDLLSNPSQDLFGTLSCENFLYQDGNLDSAWLNYDFPTQETFKKSSSII